MNALEILRRRCKEANLTFRTPAQLAAKADRQNDELIGLIRMALADGVLESYEASFLLRWLEANDAARDGWPGRVLYPRLIAALSDDMLSAEEEAELLSLLVHAIGGATPPPPGGTTVSTLPLTMPIPTVEFPRKTFCFTGVCSSGVRARCADATDRMGGVSRDRVTTELNYLVLGDLGSDDWRYSTHGRKIEAALRYNESGKAQIMIIAEEVWFDALIASGGSI